MMKRLIILNGPPRSGKDTIGGQFNNWRQQPTSMKYPLLDAAIGMSGVSVSDWHERYDARFYPYGYPCHTPTYSDFEEPRWMKDEPWNRLGGLSQRQYLIWLSEEVIKPRHGKQHFGELLKAELDIEAHTDDMDFILTDGGFEDEFVPFLGEDDWEVILIRLHREGCTFDNDSRNFLYDLCERELDVTNDGDIMDAVTTIREFIEEEK